MTNASALPLLRPTDQLQGIYTLTGVDLGDLDSFGRVLTAYDCPSQTGVFERLFMFALVTAKQPARVLEIGFRFGGTSFLMLSALEDVGGTGRLVALDPAPEPALDFSRFGDRFQLVRGSSPGDVPAAVAALGGSVELCHIDGDHSYAPVLADLEAVLPHMAPDSYALLHDAMWPAVRRATDDFLAAHRGQVIDCGFVSPWTNAEGWGGVRMLRFAPSDAGTAGGRRRGLFGWWRAPRSP
jgi:hypothetical protein